MGLKRELGPISVFAVASGAMISSGLFVLPAVVFASVGPGVSLCYLLAAVLLVPTLLSKGELMTAMPKAGGEYFFIDRSLGPGFGTAGGVAAWASVAFKSAFALLGIGLLAAYVWGWEMGGWQVKAVACGGCLVFTGLNLIGVKHVGRLQVIMVAVLIGILLAYVAASLGHLEFPHYTEYFPHNWNSVLAGAAMVFVSFGGVTKVASMGEEVRRPSRDLLLGMFSSAIVVSVLYVVVAFVTVGVLPTAAEQWRAAPLSQAAEIMWGPAGALALGVAAIAAFLTTANAGILAASRTMMAMAQDGLLPRPFSYVSARRGTPPWSILLTSAFLLAVILLLDLELFVKAASAMRIVVFMFVMVAVVLMRESRIPTYQPTWRSPGYPWVQIVGVLCYVFLLVELGSLALAVTAVIMGAGIAWFALYAKVHVMRESALIRLAARLARTDFEDHDLEAELARVARERDQKTLDRFDQLIEKCTMLDLSEPVSRGDLFGIVAENLAPRLARQAEEVRQLLERREALSSTVIRPGLAIPHLIVEGLESFEVLLVRSRQGIAFEEGEHPVHAVFVLAASPEERNFYLKALVAVAEIAQEEGFDQKWLAASSAEALREVVLAAERRREPGQDD